MSRKLPGWYLGLSAALVALSAGFYALQLAVFRRPQETFFYMLQDLAFVPVQVLLVTLILNDLMARRERRERMQKMNMVIGAFFSEYGYSLLRRLLEYDAGGARLGPSLALKPGWTAGDFADARATLGRYQPEISLRPSSLPPLRSLLTGNKTFLLGLLENQNLLEHASFTDLLWAVSHLTEELEFRRGFGRLPSSDLGHLAGDVKRAYSLLLNEWLNYAEHLRFSYPHIFSLVVRTNPFDPGAHVVVDG